jgi:hypothetical protein
VNDKKYADFTSAGGFSEMWLMPPGGLSVTITSVLHSSHACAECSGLK